MTPFEGRSVRVALGALIVSAGLFVASCSGGVNTTPVPTPPPTSSPSNALSIPVNGGSLTLPGVNAQVPTLTFTGGAPSGVTIAATSSVTAPGGVPGPSNLKRKIASLAGAVPFFFVTFTVSASISAQYISGETVTLASNDPPAGLYYAEFDDITAAPATKLGTAGPGSVSGNVATISNGGAITPTLAPGHTYLLQFYYLPAGTATPTPSPTPLTPSSTTTTIPIVPSPSASSGQAIAANNAGFAASVSIGGYTPNSSTTVTATLGTALPTGITANMLPAGVTVLSVLSLTTPTQITFGNTNCGGCAYHTPAGTFTVPLTIVTSFAGKTYYAEECQGTTCNPGSYDVVALQQNGVTLTLPSNAFADFTGLGPAATSIVFFNGTTPSPAPSASASATGTIAQGPAVFPSAGPYGLTFTFNAATSPTSGSAALTGYDYAPPTAIPSPAPNTSPAPAAGVTPIVVAAWTFTPAGTITIPNPASTITGLPIPPFGKQYYTFFGDITAGQSQGYGLGGTFNALTGTLAAAAPGGTTTAQAGHTYIFEVVAF